MSKPSLTSQVVALTRAGLDRPHSAEGDPAAQQALCAGLRFSPPAWLQPSIAVRTRFVDDQVLAAISAGISQVVICGAGYDDRALRFRTSGVRFFELDHPDTQGEKAALVRSLSSGASGPIFVAADFRTDNAAEALQRAGHDGRQPSLFICEGLLVYLEQPMAERLLGELADQAGPGSILAASLSTHADGLDSAEVTAVANSRRRNAEAEPWRLILPVDEHLAVLSRAGWTVTTQDWSPPATRDGNSGRQGLLVAAELARA